jgi:hypothetical protein
MALPTSKELRRLAADCRKAGIKHFKCGEIEFTLGDSPAPARKGKAVDSERPDADFQSDELTEEQLLGWSVTPIPAPNDPGLKET